MAPDGLDCWSSSASIAWVGLPFFLVPAGLVSATHPRVASALLDGWIFLAGPKNRRPRRALIVWRKRLAGRSSYPRAEPI